MYRKGEYFMDKKKELDRMREYMCAHFRNCEGCPISEAARKVKLRCADFRRKKPNEVEFIIRTWKYENTPVRSE